MVDGDAADAQRDAGLEGVGIPAVTDANVHESLSFCRVCRSADGRPGYAVWAAQDGVYGCAVASCGSPIKIADATVNGSIQGVAYDGQDVYYADQGTGASDGEVVR